MPFACPPCCRESSERHFLFPSIARKERAPKEQELLTAKDAKECETSTVHTARASSRTSRIFFAYFAVKRFFRIVPG